MINILSYLPSGVVTIFWIAVIIVALTRFKVHYASSLLLCIGAFVLLLSNVAYTVGPIFLSRFLSPSDMFMGFTLFNSFMIFPHVGGMLLIASAALCDRGAKRVDSRMPTEGRDEVNPRDEINPYRS